MLLTGKVSAIAIQTVLPWSQASYRFQCIRCCGRLPARARMSGCVGCRIGMMRLIGLVLKRIRIHRIETQTERRRFLAQS